MLAHNVKWFVKMPLSIVHLSGVFESTRFKSLRYLGTAIVRHRIEQQKIDQRSESSAVSQTQTGKLRSLFISKPHRQIHRLNIFGQVAD